MDIGENTLGFFKANDETKVEGKKVLLQGCLYWKILKFKKQQETRNLGNCCNSAMGTSQSQPWAGCVDSEVKKLVEFIIYDASWTIREILVFTLIVKL